MERDWDDQLIRDPFGDRFSEPVLAQVPLPGVRVTRYVLDYDEQTLANWKFCTNDDQWRGQPPDAWYIRDVTGQKVQFGGFEIGQLQFDIVSNPLEMELPKADGSAGTETRRYGWLAVRALRSSIYKDDSDQEQVARVAKQGAIKQVWIDKDGKKSADPYHFAFRNARQRDFNQIVNQS